MKNHDLQSIELQVPKAHAFAFIREPHQLPRWAHAFASVADAQAVLRTPNGEVTIHLEVRAAQEQGTVDWIMTFPDHSVASAFSRVVELGPNRCAFTFVLTPPPVPLEQLEGALAQQSKILTEELRTLKHLVEHHV